MHKKRLVVGGIVGVVGLLFAVFGSGKVFATVTCGNPDATTGIITCTDSETGAVTYKYSSSASATASVTVGSACSFSRGQGDTGEYSGTLSNGATIPVVGSTFITACNDPGGYAIYAVGYSNNTFGNTDLIFNNTPNSTNNIQTDGSGSHWGMSLAAAVSGKPNIESGFGDAGSPHVIPSAYTKIASYDSVTASSGDTSLVGQAVTVTYSATASSTQPAGTYAGAVKYTMVHPASIAAPTITMEDLQYMQDFANLSSANKAALLANMTTGEQHQLIDFRDGKTYYVAKLADGHVWMTQNLDLNITAGSTALTSENTDISTDTSIYTETSQQGAYALKGSGDYGYTISTDSNNVTTVTWVPESTTIASGDLSGSTWTNDYNNPYSYDKLDNGDPYYPDSTVTEVAAGDHAQAGNYYNWTAAIASNDSSSLTSDTYSNIANNPKNSICPKGWRLPTIADNSGDNAYDQPGSTSEFGRLNQLYNGGLTNDAAGLMAAPLYFVRSGYVSSGSLGYAGNRGYYWSSTVHYSSNARSLNFYATYVSPAYVDDRGGGFSVRCVAR